MFDVKYVFSNSPLNYYKKFESSDNYDTYRFEYPTSLMFKARSELSNWNSEFIDPFLNQNNFIQLATGSDEVLKNVNFEIDFTHYYEGDKTVVHYITFDEIQDYYIYIPKEDIDFVIIDGILYYMSDDYQYGYNVGADVISSVDYNEPYIIDVTNTYDIYIGYSNYYEDSFYAYSIDEEELLNAYRDISYNLAKIDEFNEHYIKAEIKADEDGLMYTSIPYDKGWKVFIDGKEVKTKLLTNTLLSFDIKKGHHIIELKYKIPYIIPSIIISAISVPLVYLFNKKIKKTR